MDRRTFLAGALGAAVGGPALAAVDSAAPMLRGTLDASELGLKPEGATAQSRGLQELLNIASDDDRQLFLPAGTHLVGDLRHPPRTPLPRAPRPTKLAFTAGPG